MHRIVAGFLQKRNEFFGANAFKALAEQAAADSAEPCAGKLVLQLTLIALLFKRIRLPQLLDLIQRRRFVVGIVFSLGSLRHNLIDHVTKIFFDFSERKLRNGHENIFIFFNIKTFFHALAVFKLNRGRIQFPLIHVQVVGDNFDFAAAVLNSAHIAV